MDNTNTAGIPLITFYKGWGRYQSLLVAMITPLTDDQLAFSVPGQWPVGRILQHMIADRAWWFHLWMGEGSDELAAIAAWDTAAQKRELLTTHELLAGLNSTWELVQDTLTKRTSLDLTQVFNPPAALSEEERKLHSAKTREWIIWHVLEHEIHHGGEVSLLLGMQNMPGIYGKF